MEEILSLTASARGTRPAPPLRCANTPDERAIIVLNKRFRILDLLATGGTSYVHRALDLRADAHVHGSGELAIKVPRNVPAMRPLGSDFRAQLIIREVLMAHRISHRNILRIYDFHCEGNIYYLTMEYIRGESLSALLQRAPSNRLAHQAAIAIIRGIGAGLIAAHRQQIVHSDLKPSNILIGDQGELKLIDFANARSVDSRDSITGVAARAAHFGFTAAYSSLETIEDRPATASDDIYSLACLSYEMMAGRHPYDRRSPQDALRSGLAPERPPQLTLRQWHTLRKALQLRAPDRLQQVSELLRVF